MNRRCRNLWKRTNSSSFSLHISFLAQPIKKTCTYLYPEEKYRILLWHTGKNNYFESLKSNRRQKLSMYVLRCNIVVYLSLTPILKHYSHQFLCAICAFRIGLTSRKQHLRCHSWHVYSGYRISLVTTLFQKGCMGSVFLIMWCARFGNHLTHSHHDHDQVPWVLKSSIRHFFNGDVNPTWTYEKHSPREWDDYQNVHIAY